MSRLSPYSVSIMPKGIVVAGISIRVSVLYVILIHVALVIMYDRMVKKAPKMKTCSLNARLYSVKKIT